jgi:light-regulated signal transduction histidine kinase (bacteriophytochrome)/CheY-like chemotaxis protein
MNMHDHEISNPQEIVVVDDSLESLQLLTNILQKHGYNVRPASSALLGLETMAARLPDLILLDVKMQDMDGYEVCRRLKSEEQSRKIPVIFISGLGETADKLEGFRAGGVDYITKPVEPEELLARVRTHLLLQELSERLEQKIRERTDELMAANRQLLMEITERKQAEKDLKAREEEIRKLNQELEQRVRDRTAQLEAANKELDAFAYSVSHDLRAPLRHIDGFMEMLKKKAGTVLDEQNRHYMDTISEAANKMGLLIDDLLSFSRMGRHAMSFQQVDLGTMVRDVIRELEPDAAGRNIEWGIGDLPAVGGDAAMLRIVLDNLIANALKFTRPRQQARIEVGSLPGQASEAVLFVRDNGVGFDMTYVDKLFGVFQRLHRAEEFEGTGIGLANVRRIIDRHGGRTWAEGQVNQGAVFYFSLPQKEC